MHVALFGGSFNPPHVGHQLAALYVLETAPVDALWLLPCYQHAFDKALEPFAHRVAMCEAMGKALGPRVRVETIEAQLGGTSRTLLTVKALRAAYPDHRFSLMIGSDLKTERQHWYGADELLSLIDFIVVGRAGADPAAGVAMPAVSSTEIRQRLLAGQPVDAFVPRQVLAVIEREKLYRTGEGL
ncbi:MAG: nicotinate (nicotinamide) nucleotide adenylyltransferase [Deltaproteobacteria bacterium]|nr:nicotinate (nicotinamide) nucleotide adenylyltransferase [Deltaproteobacteria bacterium]